MLVKETVDGMLQKTLSLKVKSAEGGDVICKSIFHNPLPYVAATNLLD